MRKAYSAPRIEFESFASSTNIAGNCEEIVGNPSKGTCGIPGNSMVMFSETVTGCTFHVTTDDYNGFCYHVPTEAKNLFNS